MIIDSHSHIYSEEFDSDRSETILRAHEAGVSKIIMPNIDSTSVAPMLETSAAFPQMCIPLMGLHPTSVNGNYQNELALAENWLRQEKFAGIGEIGIDLYWDKTFLKEQQYVFRRQIQIAKEMNLPVVIHVRNSFNEVFSIVGEEQTGNLKGIFHCFNGSALEAKKIIEIGFLLGIGGVVTFKNSGLGEVVRQTGIEFLALETDSPYLAPAPFRGKRNESSYINYIAEKIAELCSIPFEEVAETTSKNVSRLFGL